MKTLKHLLLFGLLTALLPAAAWAEPGPVSLNRNVLIEGPTIQLQDLFLGLDANSRTAGTPVAKAPQPGQSIELEARWLGAVARAYGIDWQPRSTLDSATVERASHTVGADQLRAVIRDALLERGLDGKLRVELDQPNAQMLLPVQASGDLQISAMTFDDRSGRFFARIEAPVENDAAVRISLTGAAREMTELPVLRRRVQSGEVITAGDIEWTEVEVDSVGRNIVQSAEEMIGMSPRRTISQGRLIRESDLQLPILIRKNSIVTLELIQGGLRLTVQGRALENGAHGQAIRVMNTQSNRIITGSVRNSNSVLVTSATQTAQTAPRQ